MYRKILVASDGSKTAARAVDRAVEVARVTGATLAVLTVGPRDQAQRTAEAEAERARTAGVAEVEVKVSGGDATDVILDEAARGGYDLLVVGNKGMTGVSRFLHTSVPNKVSHHLPIALLIVRTT